MSPYEHKRIDEMTPEEQDKLVKDTINFRRWMIMEFSQNQNATTRINEFGCDAFRKMHAGLTSSEEGSTVSGKSKWGGFSITHVPAGQLTAIVAMILWTVFGLGMGIAMYKISANAKATATLAMQSRQDIQLSDRKAAHVTAVKTVDAIQEGTELK
jgi:hypothetical protein